MAGTFPIPLTTLTVGSHEFGPMTLALADSTAALSIDRTVANGLNSQPATTSISLTVYLSEDNGATWYPTLQASGIAGGVFSHHGVQINTSWITGSLSAPGLPRLAKARVVAAGASVAAAGSLVIS